MLKSFVDYGLQHWGADDKGVATTRRFLLEWLSFLYRYIPVGLLEVVPQRLNWRPPRYFGRNDLETLMASADVSDWLKLTELAGLPPVDTSVAGQKNFEATHKSYAWKREDNAQG